MLQNIHTGGTFFHAPDHEDYRVAGILAKLHQGNAVYYWDTYRETVTLLSFATITGNSIETANLRYLNAELVPQCPSTKIGGGVYVDTWELDLSDGDLLPEVDELEQIIDVCESFYEYPILSEDEWMQVEQEWFDEEVWPLIVELTDDSDVQCAIASKLHEDDYAWTPSEAYLNTDRFYELVSTEFGLTKKED